MQQGDQAPVGIILRFNCDCTQSLLFVNNILQHGHWYKLNSNKMNCRSVSQHTPQAVLPSTVHLLGSGSI